MKLIFHILSIVAIAAMALMFCVLISVKQVPSIHRFAPRQYFKLGRQWFAVQGDAGSGVVCAIQYYFGFLSAEFDSILVDSFNVLLVKICSSCLVPAIRLYSEKCMS